MVSMNSEVIVISLLIFNVVTVNALNISTETLFNYINDEIIENWNNIESLSYEKWELLGHINITIDHINEKIEYLEEHCQFMNKIETLLSKSLKKTELELIDLMKSTHNLYTEFSEMIKLDETTKISLAKKVTSHTPEGLSYIINRSRAIILPKNESSKIISQGSFMEVFLNTLQESDIYMYNLQQSKQQMLYYMYRTLLMNEIISNSMMQFSWMILKIASEGNFLSESEIATNNFYKAIEELTTNSKSAFKSISRAIWRCDPGKHVEGETYAQITKFLQGYIENEVDMNSEGTCRENCAYYQHSKNYGCFKEKFCSRQPPCDGKIHWCQYVDSYMTICLAPINKHDRRYEWVEYENGKIYGKKKYCPRGTTKVESWWRWLFWHCSYCFCICENTGFSSDRYFSLREAISDVKNNKIITGLRFVKINGVFHLQISEGKLLHRGIIDTSTVAWREVKPLDVRRAQANVDYYQLSLDERAIDLDDLEGPAGTVLTGVRFRKLGTHLNFEIQTLLFNYTMGKLDIENPIWIGNNNTNRAKTPRTQLKMVKPDIPTLCPVSSEIDSKSDQYINFDHSDLNADFAQTTVPFIDIQPVITSIPMPLSGAGIYHKGKKSYGGFIGIKIFTYDFAPHINVIRRSNNVM